MACGCEYLIILVAIILISIIQTIRHRNRLPIFNIYRRSCNFYWLKIAFMYTILKLKQARDRKKAKSSPTDYKQLDLPQKLSSHEKAIDAVYFNGAGSQGDFLVTGMARRKNKLIDGFLYLKIANSDFGLLESPKLPGTSLYQTEESEEYSAEGITITSLETMKKWKITYTGIMKKHENHEEKFQVQLNIEWTSKLPYFNFDSDMDALAMAKSMAKEPWSREYFKTLQEIHQTHYEQHGNLKGTATIDGKTYSINMDALRDHSFGEQREWRSFHRYGLHFFTTANGDRFTVGTICMPMAFSRLTMGYIYVAKEHKIYPITSCDLELYQHGDNGIPPIDYAFSCTTEHSTYYIAVQVIHSPAFYLSENQESRVVERLCKFQVNGIRGWGAAEWQYRNITGNPLNY